MPLEVQEIAIQMQVFGGRNPGGPTTGQAPEQSASALGERETLVEECVRRVLQAVRETRER